MKMLVVFEKTPRLRHIGHLDLMRTMQRALRRSDLPIRYSQGFNPHILLTFAAPLSVGMPGRREIMEIPVEGNMSPELFMEKLSAALPPDLIIRSVRAVDDKHPASMASLQAARYECVFDENASALENAVDAFLAQKEIMVMRKTKSGEKLSDIRPMIYELQFVDHKMYMTLAISEQATCKPDLLFSSLCEFANISTRPHCTITRLQMFAAHGEQLLPLEEA